MQLRKTALDEWQRVEVIPRTYRAAEMAARTKNTAGSFGLERVGDDLRLQMEHKVRRRNEIRKFERMLKDVNTPVQAHAGAAVNNNGERSGNNGVSAPVRKLV